MKKILFTCVAILSILTAKSQTEDSASNTSKLRSIEKADTPGQLRYIVEKEAAYRGGTDNFFDYIKHNLKYPKGALKNKIEGTVSVSFTVNTDGSLINIKVTKEASPELDAEAIRLIEKSPRWTPGIQNGIPVKEKFNIDIDFKLPPEKVKS